MWSSLAAFIDLTHALLMVAWVVGLPLLFWRRWPRLSWVYGVYAIVFVVMNQASQYLLGECFLTTLSRACWLHSGNPPAGSGEWFTVRVANAVFRLTPSHRAIKIASEVLIVATAAGALLMLRSARRHPERSQARATH